MARDHPSPLTAHPLRTPTRRLAISRRAALALLCGALFIGAIATFSLAGYVRDRNSPASIAALRQQNERLRETNRSFEDSARQLEQQLAAYEDRTAALAIMAGVEDAISARQGRQRSNQVGVGGSANRADLVIDLPSLERRAELLDGKLDSVEKSFVERQLWYSARPAILPVKGVLTSGFGYRADPITGQRAFHRGIDLSARPGNEVLASADGTVIKAGRLGSLGRAVVLMHGFGFSTRYGHLEHVDVEVGQKVERGEVLGRVGRSGRATGYHVHYEVHENGRPQNPIAFVLESTRLH